MFLVSDSFPPHGWIPDTFALGKHDAVSHFAFAGNQNPHLRWGDVPEGTKSFAILCFDDDTPSRGDDVNQEGREVPLDLPRVRFWHWILLDVPADVREIAAGSHSAGVKAMGKGPTAQPFGTTGINDYTSWFAGTEGMKGHYYGYDGPAPPWNDARVHGYQFLILALNVETTGMHGSFDGTKAMTALHSHILGSASHVGLYAINPNARR